MVLQAVPHCHAPIHPPAPAPTPVPHPGLPLTIIPPGATTVLIGGLPAARVGDQTLHSSCVAPIPSPTGQIMPPGYPTVIIGG
jgi:uncharacterized Zn-binding protein involved in type VI secretion